MKKKVLCALFAVLIAVASVYSAFADGEKALVTVKDYTYGTCHTTYITSATIYNNGNGWYRFQFEPVVEIQYSDNANPPQIDGHDYGYARPQGTDGTLYGTAFKIYYHDSPTTWIPNSSGSSATNAKFKVYNGVYAENNNITNTTMTIPQNHKAEIRGKYYN